MTNNIKFCVKIKRTRERHFCEIFQSRNRVSLGDNFHLDPLSKRHGEKFCYRGLFLSVINRGEEKGTK